MLLEHFSDVPVSNVLKLEGLANRDSLPYAETYALGDVSKLRTMLRGTLRCVLPSFAVNSEIYIDTLSVGIPASQRSCTRSRRSASSRRRSRS